MWPYSYKVFEQETKCSWLARTASNLDFWDATMKRSAEQIAEINGMVVAKLFLERDDLSPHGPGGRGRAPGAGAPQEERFSNCRSQGTSIVIITSIVLAIVWGVIASLQAQTPPPPATLFQNVRVFDGKSGSLSEPQNVLVRGNKIDRISTDSILIDASASTVLIDGSGRTLMPGLIDMHWHTMLVRPTPAALLAGDIGHLNIMAGAEATATLMRGFTTVRDLGGPAFGLKRAIDEGYLSPAHASIHRAP